MSKEPPTIITDDFLEADEPALISGLKYILTEEGARYSFITKSLNDQDEIVSEHHIKTGEDLEESELNLLVGAVLNEFKIRDIQPSTDLESLRSAAEQVLKDLTENKPE